MTVTVRTAGRVRIPPTVPADRARAARGSPERRARQTFVLTNVWLNRASRFCFLLLFFFFFSFLDHISPFCGATDIPVGLLVTSPPLGFKAGVGSLICMLCHMNALISDSPFFYISSFEAKLLEVF